ncbi:transcriptional regulator [Brevibacillus parabrevis]|uniref:helix-turn-helix transcriptional regulator n=1 Tax=Brevibacillus parabrevis TaxID=54914 RepID=UPI0007AB88CE|nr:YafY family protein [Brevibacillus parabrevis]KZE47947.1 transcriptional regulator [Brevibacillus parabrevis]
MNKSDRLLAIVLELQRKRTLRAEDLAATFETSVRTIYRDMQALSEAGVPIIGSPGQGYSLMEGFFLPPVRFTAEEAVALLIGADLVEQAFDRNYGNSARDVQRKVEAILSHELLQEVSRIRSTFRLIHFGEQNLRKREKQYAELLHQAIMCRQKVRFRYKKHIPEPDGNRESIRDVAPYGLVLTGGLWALLAYCDLRKDIRRFRLTRMDGLTMLADSFELPEHFSFEDYKPPDNREWEVQPLVQSAISDQVKEEKSFYIEEMEEKPDGVLVKLRVRHLDEIFSWVLGMGAKALVLEPSSLREKIREEAGKLLKRY